VVERIRNLLAISCHSLYHLGRRGVEQLGNCAESVGHFLGADLPDFHTLGIGNSGGGLESFLRGAGRPVPAPLRIRLDYLAILNRSAVSRDNRSWTA
jgi:hypothetical protein